MERIKSVKNYNDVKTQELIEEINDVISTISISTISIYKETTKLKDVISFLLSSDTRIAIFNPSCSKTELISIKKSIKHIKSLLKQIDGAVDFWDHQISEQKP